MTKELPKNYNAKESEKKWQDFWEKEGIYKFDDNSKNPVFSIDTPPPYISSDSLHTGHAMSYTQAEIIIRYHRMKGENIFYPMGFDDNGLPTERFVERKYKVDKSKITRKEFVELCLRETREGGKKYEELWRKLGLSVDWSLLYSTINPLSQKISQRSFIDLYKKGRIYREEAPTFWCTQCQTALAQADLEDKEEKSLMYDIEFKFDSPTGEGDPAIISTTRPELIPACVALYVNPKDERYQKYIGGFAIAPITKDRIPVKTSETVEMEKGTGLMMVCTWGDTEDIEKWKADKLDTKLIIDKNGRVNEKGGKYEGMKIKNMREEILKDLEELKLIKNKTEIEHTLNIHERCKQPVDFFVSPQWFVKILDIKNELRKRGDELNWHPKFMKIHLDNWIDGLKWDWCISRDRFFGIPLPLWYCQDCGEIILPEDDELPVDPRETLPKNPICPKCQSKNIKGELQVMDTWMTSSTTPLINNHWKETDEKNIYPMSVRVQGFEIIRTWLFYTLVKAHLNTDSIPWKDLMISGWGLAKNGEKMSKSLNNFVTAESMLEKYGADALRFWSCGATLGMNLRFSEDDMRSGQKLLTKLWNATRFVMMNLEDYDRQIFINRNDLCEADVWILSELEQLIWDTTYQLDNYEFARAKILLEHFFWIKFADNYIELVKGRLYGEDKKGKLSAQFTLYSVIATLIKLFAPILPHITEELYQLFIKEPGQPNSIHISSWPKGLDFSHPTYMKTPEWFKNKKEVLKNGEKLLEIIAEIRKQKAEKNIKLGESFKKLTIGSNEEFIKKIQEDLKNLSHAGELIISEKEKKIVIIE